MKEKEVKVLDYQIAASFILIGTVIVAIILTYDFKQKLLKKPRIFNDKEAYAINLTNRVTIAILALSIVYLDYKIYQEAKRTNINIPPLTHQLEASILKALGTIITVYVLLEAPDINSIASIENP